MADKTYDSTSETPPEGGMLFGRVLDGSGGGRDISWTDANHWSPSGAGEVLWLHMDRTVPGVEAWLAQELELPAATVEALVSNETRPRAFMEEAGLVTILRGINFNPGAEPEDMIAMQVRADASRVITLRRRRLQTPRDVLAEIDAGGGPKTAGDLVAALIEQLVAKMNRAIVEQNERIDRLEDSDISSDPEKYLDDIADIRRQCLALKRFMSPQHEALMQIMRSPPDWMSQGNLRDISETIDRLKRYLEDLDVSKESALVLQDDLNNRAAAEANKTMYMLSIIAAIFLPLSFLTGLLGINVGGMPGVEDSSAFWITVVMLVVLLGVQLYVFRRLKWL